MHKPTPMKLQRLNGSENKKPAGYESENNLIRKRVVPFPLRRSIVPVECRVPWRRYKTVGIQGRSTRGIDGMQTEHPTSVLYEATNKRFHDKQFRLHRHAAHACFPRSDNFCRSFRREGQRDGASVSTAPVCLFRIHVPRHRPSRFIANASNGKWITTFYGLTRMDRIMRGRPLIRVREMRIRW